jgi:hypothetical protein
LRDENLVVIVEAPAGHAVEVLAVVAAGVLEAEVDGWHLHWTGAGLDTRLVYQVHHGRCVVATCSGHHLLLTHFI